MDAATTDAADAPIRSVVVLGGGTAGWLTASILAADHMASEPGGLTVTLLESPTVPTLGVGEGTWPSLRDTLARIGLPETVFLRRCQASFKQGTRFVGWHGGTAPDVYYHPFDALPNEDEVAALALWRAAPVGTPFARAVSAQAALCEANRAPKQAATPEYAAVANYGYHLDAGAFAALLAEHATQHLGVRHVVADVEGVRRDAAGDIAALCTADGEVEGDLFVDCSGARAALVGEALGASLRDVSDVLFNDRAIALQVPHADGATRIASQTDSVALEAGWVWDIALQTRRGVGYVHSSAHTDEDAARAALTAYLRQTAPHTQLTGEDARLISFRSAYRETPWVRNAVAIGMAQGFVEPLEASAIVMVELAATMLSDTLPPTRGLTGGAARRFNERCAYRWSRIVDFLKLHYVLSKRGEPYWAAHRDQTTWPDRLQTSLARWRHEPPSREDFPQAREIFPAASYAYVLYGMGHETTPPPHARRRDAPGRARAGLAEVEARTRRLLDGLPGNADLLAHVAARGLPQHPALRTPA